MGPFFKNDLAASILPEISEIDIDGKRFLLGHGDTVAMTKGYRLWRWYLRSPFFKVTAALATPRGVWTIATKLSKKSRRRGAPYPAKNHIEERLRDFARDKLSEGLDAVLFGHSHAAGV